VASSCGFFVSCLWWQLITLMNEWLAPRVSDCTPSTSKAFLRANAAKGDGGAVSKHSPAHASRFTQISHMQVAAHGKSLISNDSVERAQRIKNKKQN